MRCGTINCKCGQLFYFESNSETVQCPTCEMIFDTTIYPEKPEEPIEEVGGQNGTDI